MEQPEGNQGGYGSTGGQQGGGSKKLQQTHAQVNEVVDIMRENVEKVIDRDIKLSELDDRADALQQGASQFETQAAKLKRKYWWKNMQMWIILIAIGLIVVVIIVASQSKQQGPQGVVAPQQPIVNNQIPAVQNPPVEANAGETAGMSSPSVDETNPVENQAA
jgi:hypothetical protein